MKVKKRNYISLYFQNGNLEGRKKKDLTISFNAEDPLYEKCKKLGSSKIQEIVKTKSLRELKNKAREKDRTLGNLIKVMLRKHFERING